ncbi:Sugar transporter family protein [Taphrina deformans PYCC 5710]|uniref:Sugar transporter family protein n=1 Tax=Taphrina deformans (strain PYCC 5710 / ATCC 11124 / CBS 356.35 / IMI 108563 / JCM 9778 / NBRC 8474) TaxID=1097556 RepID=R4X7N2_TAPDE|nr:Sugar transporter family protein [Taphrina deformans PYCC 5710]|eukprot:CCG81441.1 Sugar transporter family protein [Taphrina deformans PYCC 5710]
MGYNPITSLAPPKGAKLQNPITLLRMLGPRQWAFFLVSLLAWTWDAFDFFTVSLTLSTIAEDLSTKERTISLTQASFGITLALMTRSVGAIIFGALSDRFGRKWPFVANVVLYSMVEMSTGFVQTFEQFLGVRALFGVFMGGIYGACAATALEDAPAPARGLLSGLLQQGYAMGNLLAAGFYLAIVPNTEHTWRSLMWFGAGPALLIAAWRAWLPETDTYLRKRAALRAAASAGLETGDSNTEAFVRSIKPALKTHWMTLIYLVALMAGFNFLSHGSQDLYPSLLKLEKGFTPTLVTQTTVVSSFGAILGGTICGWLSDVVGRRLMIISICCLGAALIYPWAYTDGKIIMLAAFAEQFCVQGAWGVIPIHLMELAPPNFRAFVVGTSYQLGNLASSASSTIEAKIGAQFPLPDLVVKGKHTKRYNYGKVMAIFIACVYIYIIVIIALGPQNQGIDLDIVPESEKFDHKQNEDEAESFDMSKSHNVTQIEHVESSRY